VSLAALEAGKHVYSEKPLATTLADGLKIIEMARAKRLRVGAAPDTILGAACQAARGAIDAGRIGRPLTAFASVLSHGMERWHPNPAFFFCKGAGPVFDMGPYYISTLATLLGPVSAVQALGQIGFAERTITAADSKFRGETIRVETFTSVQALLEFASGVQATFLASWDVWNSRQPPIEIHGEKGSLSVPDPNWFSGRVELAEGEADIGELSLADAPMARKNYPARHPAFANYRGLGLAEMARAIDEGRPHRASAEMALHTLAVMEAMLEAAAEGRRVAIAVGCERPAPLEPDEARRLLRV
jgi:predicted dehydrogenase